MQNDVVIKLCRPVGATKSKPSESITDALQRLSESAELKPLVAGARKQGRKVVVQVFESREGYPFLIHLQPFRRTRLEPPCGRINVEGVCQDKTGC